MGVGARIFAGGRSSRSLAEIFLTGPSRVKGIEGGTMNAARCGFVAAILLAGQPFVPAGFPALAAGGRALNAGTTYGAFDLDPRARPLHRD